MKKFKIMGIFAHPDDETFGPGGSLIKYAKLGHEVQCLTLTSGQAGQSSNKIIKKDVGVHRRAELVEASQRLGINPPVILNFFDGGLNEHLLPLLKEHVCAEVNKFKPDVIIVYELGGISLHLDHIAVSKAVIQLFDEKSITAAKLYYFGINKAVAKSLNRELFLQGEQACEIDITPYWENKKQAMFAHDSQEFDYIRLIGRTEELAKQQSGKITESFELARTSLSDLVFPEADLLNGLA